MAFPLANPNVAFLRFHLNVGARLAAKTLAPLLAFFFSALYLLKVDFFVMLARAVFLDSHYIISGLLYAGLILSASRIIAPRVCLGLNGWIRHLPLKGRSYRRLALFSIFVAQMPLLVSLAVPSLLLALNLGINPAVYFAGLPVLGLSSALFVLPVQRSHVTKPLVLAACIFAASGNWMMWGGGLLLFLISDGMSGSLSVAKKNLKRKKRPRGSG